MVGKARFDRRVLSRDRRRAGPARAANHIFNRQQRSRNIPNAPSLGHATPFHTWRPTMNKFIHTAVTIAMTVLCTAASISVMQAANVGFPFPQGWASLPHLAILSSLVYTSSVFMQFLVNRLFGRPDTPGAGPAQAAN
jgi:hypothetical protein